MLWLAAATYVHATIGGTVATKAAEDDWWARGGDIATGLGAIATAVAAGFTAFMAFQTKTLAERTKDMADKTNEVATETQKLAKETRESIKVAQDAIAAEDRRTEATLQPHLTIGFNETGKLMVKNIGGGLAANIAVSFNKAFAPFTRSYAPGLAPADTFQLPPSWSPNYNTTHVSITYKDVFGNGFESTFSFVTGSPTISEAYTVRRLPPEEP